MSGFLVSFVDPDHWAQSDNNNNYRFLVSPENLNEEHYLNFADAMDSCGANIKDRKTFFTLVLRYIFDQVKASHPQYEGLLFLLDELKRLVTVSIVLVVARLRKALVHFDNAC